MTVRQVQDADWPRVIAVVQAFFRAHPEALDDDVAKLDGLAPASLQIPGCLTFVVTGANGTVQGSMTVSRDADTLCILNASYNPALPAATVKAASHQLAQRIHDEAVARGMTHLHGRVMQAYTAGVNYWRSFGLLDSVQTVQTPNGPAWEATVDLTRFAQGVA